MTANNFGVYSFCYA